MTYMLSSKIYRFFLPVVCPQTQEDVPGRHPNQTTEQPWSKEGANLLQSPSGCLNTFDFFPCGPKPKAYVKMHGLIKTTELKHSQLSEDHSPWICLTSRSCQRISQAGSEGKGNTRKAWRQMLSPWMNLSFWPRRRTSPCCSHNVRKKSTCNTGL